MALFRAETRLRGEAVPFAAAARRFVLRGRIATLASDGRVIPDGFVCVENDLISAATSVDAGIPPEFQHDPLIETGGTIYPGLIELHNHPSYNAIHLWSVPARFSNRGQWRGDAMYRRQVSNPATLLTHHPQDIYPKSVARFVECRALLGGATTTQGLTLPSLGGTLPYYQGLVRNVEFSYGPNWPVATDHIDDFTSFPEFRAKYGPLMNQKLSRLLIHLCEGTDQAARAFFSNLIDPNDGPLVSGNLISIHGTALGPAQFQQLHGGGGLVWSPLSNFLLYGATTDMAAATKAGITVAIGCDWGPSGTKNLLGELKIAKLTSDKLTGLFSDQQLAQMVTSVPAKMMGWDSFLGSIEAGKQADLLVIGKADGDPYSTLIAATETDVAAVVIGGKLRAGRAGLVDPTTPGVELIHVANQSIVLDLVDDPNHPLAKVTLQGAIATLAYALEHLPDLAKTFQMGIKAFNGAPTGFLVRLEMDEQLASDALVGAAAIGPSDVDPMKLDPITAVDDTTFNGRLKANGNLPQWLKAAL
jgi:cytosine/adenosine deaminase-related metal-dependent hydrolase